jgi:hypothetical protein
MALGANFKQRVRLCGGSTCWLVFSDWYFQRQCPGAPLSRNLEMEAYGRLDLAVRGQTPSRSRCLRSLAGWCSSSRSAIRFSVRDRKNEATQSVTRTDRVRCRKISARRCANAPAESALICLSRSAPMHHSNFGSCPTLSLSVALAVASSTAGFTVAFALGFDSLRGFHSKTSKSM